MDKQANIQTNPINLIPVNTRTIGAPEGIYILYLEDYVHTFIKKILSDTTDTEYRMEKNTHPPIALYGRSVEENGRYRLVVSGAAALDGGSDKMQQLNGTYFPSCTCIGTAYAGLNKDAGLRLELTLNNRKVILDDFYIYYDQNEEMQNYLIDWNTDKEKHRDRERFLSSSPEPGTRIRNDVDDAVRLGRIAQAYNREEAKVSFMWNVMNVLCLGFVVCVMAYGIISINNYNKMQNMQASLDYCLEFIAENTSLKLQSAPASAAVQQEMQTPAPEAVQQGTQPPDEETWQGTQAAEEGTPVQQEMQTDPENFSQPEAGPVQDENQQAQTQTPAEPDGQTAAAQPSQYYIVRRGDTLRTISYNIYGDYSYVDAICQLNQIENPNNILYGQKLLLP